MTIGLTTQARARMQQRGDCVEELSGRDHEIEELASRERDVVRLLHTHRACRHEVTPIMAPLNQGTTPTEQAAEIGQSLAGLKLGESQTYLNLTLFPLIGDGEAASGYLLLDEALDRQLVRVTEVSKYGSIPELALENTSAESVLLVDGDELVGAKQNRVLNLSILVAGGKRLIIPVSCVEQRRWAYRSPEFQAAKRTLFSRARARKAQSVSDALRTRGERRANQSQVWACVAEKADHLGVRSETLAMSDIYVDRAAQLDAYVRAFRPVPAQRGAVVAIGGKVVDVELFDAATAYSRYFEKLVRAYALDVIERAPGEQPAPPERDARAFLDLVGATHGERFKALGEGDDIRLTGQSIAGGALAAGGRLVHLAAFAVDEPRYEDSRPAASAPAAGRCATRPVAATQPTEAAPASAPEHRESHAAGAPVPVGPGAGRFFQQFRYLSRLLVDWLESRIPRP
jgi:hypothetical protein